MKTPNKKYDYVFIVPVFNEAFIIDRSLKLLLSFLETEWIHKNSDWKIIVADNASADDSRQILEKLKKENESHVDYLFVPIKGRGNALKEVIKTFDSQYYLYLDADIPINLKELPSMFGPLENKRANLTVGSRRGKRPWQRKILTYGLKFIDWLIFDLKISDSQCGIKAFDQKTASLLLEKCEEIGYFLDTELLIQAQNNNLKTQEVPINWIEQRYPERKSKVNLISDAIKALNTIKKLILRTCPKIISSTISIVTIGILLFVIFIFNKIYLTLPNFLVAHQFQESAKKVVIFAFIFFIFSIFIWHVTKKIKNLPQKFATFLIATVFIAISLIAIFTKPTRSQDIYWNLLLTKGFTEQGLNPYKTTPEILKNDPWSPPVKDWRNLSMTHGPLWIIFLSIFTTLKLSLNTSLIFIKLIYFLILLFSGFLIFRLMNEFNFDAVKKNQLLLVLAWNPILFQTALIDLHNDVFILFSILISFFFFTRKKYELSTLSLIIGGFIKYAPWLLIPLPLFYLLKGGNVKKNIIKIILGIGVFLLLAFIFYLPFGFSEKNFVGLSVELSERSNYFFSLPSTIIFLLFLNPLQIKFLGIILGFFAIYYCIQKNKPFLGYLLPFLLIFLFATPWFQPWYVLWILPLLALSWSVEAILLFSTILILMHEAMPSLIISLLIGPAILIIYLIKKSGFLK
ncbi:MAG: glycosyltransferase [Patescibacteria group bacterium]|nr:glycosyltransferase [Patescibacteria group bacterium]